MTICLSGRSRVNNNPLSYSTTEKATRTALYFEHKGNYTVEISGTGHVVNLVGDINGDNKVDMKDVGLLL